MIHIDRHESVPNGAHRPYSRGCSQNGDVDDSENGKDAYRIPLPFDYHPSFVWSLLIHLIHVATAGGHGDRDDSRLSWPSPRLLAQSGDSKRKE
ncbi:hypothetical protein Y032_0172g355 [Ancylostoma ceylanicum]|uniref:Uncharacterized protein n=1 Tax=Ancylostoma ceylanicum TaxID=53326 RepID=A0A016SVK9_9BILA|nr:hypothetical protein Y032_0172g355 [Ancylostoma ceylanicum]